MNPHLPYGGGSLLYPEPTPYDVNFTLFRTPVRVHPAFWCVHLLIGALGILSGHWYFVPLWIGCVFVSILIHEFGHVLAGRHFGAESEVVLTILGGVAVGCGELCERWQRIVVYLAGPAAQLLLAAVLTAIFWTSVFDRIVDLIGAGLTENADTPARADRAFALLLPWILLIGMNVGWPLFNLLPIPPLDGGMIAKEFVESFRSDGRKPWEQDADWWKR
jgi:stage IV sporulation protein FB